MRLTSLLQEYLPLTRGPFVHFMAFIQFFYLYQVFATNDVGGYSFSLGSILLMIWSMFTVFWYFQWIGSCFSFSKRAYIMATFVGLLAYDLLIAYQFGTKELCQYSVLRDNISSAFSPEAFDVIQHSLDLGALEYFPVFVIFFLWRERKKKTLSRGMQERPLAKKALASTLIYLAMIFIPVDSYDPLINFWRSVKNYYWSPVELTIDLPPGEYPLVQESNVLHRPVKGKQRPHVFVIMVESLNASSIGATNPEGKAVTPFLNTLRDKSVYLPHFYGNSIQTAKGSFATLFSTIPVLSGKTYVEFPQLKIRSIATELKKEGYHTTFFSAHWNKSFDDMVEFFLPHGFERYDTVHPYLSKEDEAKNWRWGPSDPVFFERMFDYVDERLKEDSSPHFFAVATIANHFPFNSMPDDMKVMYPDAKMLTKHYANSVYWSDKGIEVFFKELRKRGLADNSLVIVTADHAYPLGEHGNYHLEAGYHEESHRIPFFMVWDGVLQPRVITRAHAQMDIAPTIIDALGIQLNDHNFAGRSIFDPDPKQHFLYLVQPYGKHLSVVDYPYKYRFHTKTAFEYVYHLEQDPMERTNIVREISDAQLQRYRDAIQRMVVNHQAIKQDQVQK